MSDVLIGIILLAMILYIVSPFDACPGPVDDIIVLLIGIAARKGIGRDENYEVD